MTRVLVVEPGYCPYQAGFASSAEAAEQVIEGDHQILKIRPGLLSIADPSGKL